jgi:RNase adaptor protein for sRNA GlmZ degradation
MEPHAPIPEVVVSSFAFKTGAPEANLVLDVLFLPDPSFSERVLPSVCPGSVATGH